VEDGRGGRRHGATLLAFLMLSGSGLGAPLEESLDERGLRQRFLDGIHALYNDLELSGGLDLEVFQHALVGFYNLRRSGEIARPSPLTIIDYGKPSTAERFFVIDLQARRVLFKTLVAHGVNSGVDPPHDFSNQVNSLKSSLGFFATLSTYVGRHGYSLRLRGLDPDFNHNAETRHIVIHGANYVSHSFLQRHGRLGLSWGCPALPTGLARRIIDEIRDGSCLFIYADQEDYIRGSRHLDVVSAAREFQQYVQERADRGRKKTDDRDGRDSEGLPRSRGEARAQ
jgi:hypothetical protein